MEWVNSLAKLAVSCASSTVLLPSSARRAGVEPFDDGIAGHGEPGAEPLHAEGDMPESFGIVEGGGPAGGLVQQTASTGRVTRPDTGIGLLDEQVDQRTAGLDMAGSLDRAAGTSQMGGGLG
jgi:hypothetical protein